MGAVRLQAHFLHPVVRLSLGKGLQGIKSRRYRRGNINLPYGLLWRRGNRDGTTLKQYVHIGRNQTNNLDLSCIDALVKLAWVTSRTTLSEPEHSVGDSIATTLPCLALLETLLTPGEFFLYYK